MVYFVCESCNETLKKAQVDRHLYSCKNCWGVTCVDCNFTFEGDSFRAHTSCVSEEQKYQGALFKAPKTKQKNRGVNEIWTDAVQLAATNASKGTAPKPLCAHLVRMGDLGNVPRQEKKFKNFIRNSFRALNDASVAKLWDYLDGIRNEISVKEKEATAAAIDVPVPTAPAVATPEGDENPKEKKKSKKRPREESTAEKASQDGDANGTSSKRRDSIQGVANAAPVIEGTAATNREEDGLVVDTVLLKALTKATVGILKKAPNKELAVKDLTKQATAAARAKGGPASEMDKKQLRRILQQRLKEGGLRRVAIADNVASYSSKDVAATA